MSLRLYDTASREIRDFVPLEAGRVGIYLCGATVQSPPHVGHIRSGLNFDILRRWLEHTGHTTTLVRNVTDIDDKILHEAGHDGVPFWQVAFRNERAFEWAYDVIGCLPPSIAPRATGHVTEMVALMQQLVDGGHAYEVGGEVYFSVTSYAHYGSLSRQKLENMLAAGDSDDEGVKRDPRDFALWKKGRPTDPTWPTPWGPGRPGWHLECSAMCRRYLGPEFDIHGGGLDLVFPHHENEIAQSRSAGDGFARYWLHNAWVTTAGEKMSKSLGNSLLVSEVVRRVRPVELRYYLGAAHYRSAIEFSEDALQEAGASYRRIEGFVTRAVEVLGTATEPGELPKPFVDAMDDDLGVPQALAVVHETVRAGNKALAAGDPEAVASALASVRAMTGVLGLDPLAWAASGSGEEGDLRGAVDALVAVALQARTDARARKDYAAADAVRDQLAAAGVVVEDTPSGPRWSLREDR